MNTFERSLQAGYNGNTGLDCISVKYKKGKPFPSVSYQKKKDH